MEAQALVIVDNDGARVTARNADVVVFDWAEWYDADSLDKLEIAQQLRIVRDLVPLEIRQEVERFIGEDI